MDQLPGVSVGLGYTRLRYERVDLTHLAHNGQSSGIL